MAFDVIVVGRGLMGSACARYLAEAGHRVALIGPDEPANTATHEGPFGSFHDAGRITRQVASDPVWAMLATRSIARYGTIASRSGVPFFNPCASVMAGADTAAGRAFVDRTLETARSLNTPHRLSNGADVGRVLPMFAFSKNSHCVVDPAGGVINPRAMRRAEEILAQQAGCEVIPDVVQHLDQTTAILASGTRIAARHVVLATGAYATTTALTSRAAMRVQGRTIVFAELSEPDAARLRDMPSLIFWPEDAAYDLYLLPPIRYPDGRFYIKIGGEGDSPVLKTPADIQNWFQSGGSQKAADLLLATLRKVMPDFDIMSTQTGSCAVSFTKTGYPYIAPLDDRVTLLTGGNGAGAKCADELGRLGALVAMGHDLRDEDYPTDFAAIVD